MQVLEGLRDLPFAPSVGLHQVPGTDLAEETDIRVRDDDEMSELSELDVRIARTLSCIPLSYLPLQLTLVSRTNQGCGSRFIGVRERFLF